MGGAQCRLFADHGAAVCVADFNMAAAEAVRNEIGESGGRAIAFELDVRNETRWAECINATEAEFGPVTTLCNNAGANFRVSFDDQSLEMWNIIMETGLTGGVSRHQSGCAVDAARRRWIDPKHRFVGVDKTRWRFAWIRGAEDGYGWSEQVRRWELREGQHQVGDHLSRAR